MTRYLIEKDGERQNVTSLEGYEDWDVVDTDVPMLPLDVRKAMKWAEVKRHRDTLEDDVAPTRFGLVQIDDRSKLKISGMAQVGGLVQFTMADNSVVTLDPAELWADVLDYIHGLHNQSQNLRAAIDAATTEAELDAIQW